MKPVTPFEYFKRTGFWRLIIRDLIWRLKINPTVERLKKERIDIKV